MKSKINGVERQLLVSVRPLPSAASADREVSLMQMEKQGNFVCEQWLKPADTDTLYILNMFDMVPFLDTSSWVKYTNLMKCKWIDAIIITMHETDLQDLECSGNNYQCQWIAKLVASHTM